MRKENLKERKMALKDLVTRGWLGCVLSAVAVLLTSGCILFFATQWDGWIDWTFRVRVYDDTTNATVSNASVRIIVKNETPFGAVESFVREDEPKTCVTDVQGECELTMEFNTYGTKSVWGSHAYVNFLHRNLVVAAEGYNPLDIPLKTIIKTPYEFRSADVPRRPSEITVRLTRRQD
jgi:hypothetical protein